MLRSVVSQIKKRVSTMTSSEPLPEFVLFGDSLTEWSFREATQGFGLVLEKAYAGKATIVNEGITSSGLSFRLAATHC